MPSFFRSSLRKSFGTAIIIAFSFLAQAQNITVLPILAPDHPGYGASAIEFNDSLYFQYATYANNPEIAKYNDTSYRLLRGQSTFTYGVDQYPFVYNGNLYYRFKRLGGYQIGRIDHDTAVTLFNNPDAGSGFADSTVEFNGKIYFRYMNTAGNFCLASFDGTTVSLVPQPDAGYGVFGRPVACNGNLYMGYQDQNFKQVLAKFDGNTITLHTRNSFGNGISSGLTVYNNDVYFLFNDSICHLVGNSLQTFPNPQEFMGSGTSLVVYNNKLWFKAAYFTTNPYYSLATFDGNTVQLVGDAYTGDFGFYDVFTYQGKLYFSFSNTFTQYQLARIDGNAITKIPNININDEGISPSTHVEYRGNLYFKYLSPNGLKGSLAKFDGLDITLFPDPVGLTQFRYTPALVHNGNLYMSFVSSRAYLAKLSDSSINVTLCAQGSQTITSGISGTSYQWQADAGFGYANLSNNANYSGTNTISLTLTNIPSSSYGYKYRCMVNGMYTEVYQLRFTNEWTGAVNNLWEQPGNWSCGFVPDANTDVIINAGTVVVSNSTTIHSLHLGQTVVFTVSPGINFTILH